MSPTGRAFCLWPRQCRASSLGAAFPGRDKRPYSMRTAPTIPLPIPPPAPAAPVAVQIRGADATVLYAGAAPGYISGLMQINVQVPTTIDFGNSVPLTLSIGGQASQFNVTIAVK